jgi:hypothetical protein
MPSNQRVIGAAIATIGSYAGLPRYGIGGQNDCADYGMAVMVGLGMNSGGLPGQNGNNIYSPAGWHRSGLFAETPSPVAGSFFEMGRAEALTSTSADTPHHTGIYLGSSGGYAYVAQSNWGKGDLTDPPGVYRYALANGKPVGGLVSVSSLQAVEASLSSDPGARAVLLAVWSTKWKNPLPADQVDIHFYVPTTTTR